MLEIHEVLDRLELLNPTDSFFMDLRKTILNNDKFALFRLIQKNTTSQLIEGMRRYKDDSSFDSDCFSRGQLQSKLWLINELKKLDLDLGTVFLCAGWYATLSTMLFEEGFKINKIRSFDVDPATVDIAETFNKPWFTDQWRFKALINNIHDIDYREHTWQFWSNTNNRMSYPISDIPNTIINTRCEHIENYADWYNKIPLGKLVILQGNNYFEIAEHVNCSKDINEFSSKSPMTTVLFEGELDLPKYKRFMKIGFR